MKKCYYTGILILHLLIRLDAHPDLIFRVFIAVGRFLLCVGRIKVKNERIAVFDQLILL